MSRQSRFQPVFSRNTDEHISEDHWLKEFEKKLLKESVQPRNTSSLYDQINSIMNGTKSKYPSVQAAVDDMMQRSGLSNYLKTSTDNEEGKVKTAQNLGGNLFDRLVDQIKKFVAVREWYNVGHAVAKLEKAEGNNSASSAMSAIMSFKNFPDPELKTVRVPIANWGDFTLGYCAGHNCSPEQTKLHTEHINRMMEMSGMGKKASNESERSDTPEVIAQNPAILRTIENYIKATRGNLPVPAILDKIRSIHQGDVSEDRMWEDDKLIRLISKLNLEAKKNNPASYEDFSNLAVGDRDTADSDVDPSNTDAFNALMPAKM